MALRLFALAVVAAFACAACGRHAHRAATSRPLLPHAVAKQLASLSDEVANKLVQGDSCGAAAAAVNLDNQTSAAIVTGEVPRSLRASLRRAVDDLAQKVHCVQPLPVHDHGQHKGEHKHHGGEGD